MERLVVLLLFLVVSYAARYNRISNNDLCQKRRLLKPRPHSVSIVDFGAIGDGKMLNTVAFQNAIFYLKSFADKGGAQLYVPAGLWLTRSFNLTSNLTLFIESGATIIASQDYALWEVDEPFPSYGRSNEVLGGRYRSLISGQNLNDVIITGDNGIIDGQGEAWWELYESDSLNYSRPHLIELINSEDVIISNLTFVNSPAWSIHPVYNSQVLVQNISVHSPPDSPHTSGIVLDSSEDVCIRDSNLSVGHNAIALKSSWDKYGIAYRKTTTNVYITNVGLKSSLGAGLAFGSQVSGGISNIFADTLHIQNSLAGVTFITTGGFIKDIFISEIELENVHTAIYLDGVHQEDRFNSNKLPVITRITLKDITGSNISLAGNFSGSCRSPITSICLSNISLSVTSEASDPWYVPMHQASQTVYILSHVSPFRLL